MAGPLIGYRTVPNPAMEDLGNFFQQMALSTLRDRQESTRQQTLQQMIQQGESQRANEAFGRSTLLKGMEADPATQARLATLGKVGGVDLGQLQPTEAQALAPINASIAGAKDVNAIPDDTGILSQAYANTGGQMTDLDSVLQTLKSASTRKATLSQNASDESLAQPVDYTEQVPGGGTQRVFTTRGSVQDQGGIQQTPSDTEAAKRAGGIAGADAAARLPYEKQLAQIRANMQLLNQQDMDKYKAEHPKATSQELNRKALADSALVQIDSIRKMVDEMDRQGMLGPLASHAADLASGKIGSSALFKNPGQAGLAADFFSSMNALQTSASAAHSRTGAGGPLIKKFEAMVPAYGDKPVLNGHLNSVERLMRTYSKNPAAPPELNLQEYGFGPDVQQGIPLTPGLERLGQRGSD